MSSQLKFETLMPKQTKSDSINHPKHYTGSDPTYEAINVIEAWSMGFCDGNVVKYLCRWKQKGGLEDLRKAQWYLNRFIEEETKAARFARNKPAQR
jgi:hypothetical protein